MAQPPDWSDSEAELFTSLEAGEGGLSSGEATRRLARCGPNRLARAPRTQGLRLLLRQFTSPIILILLGAALLSFLLDSPTDGLIILVIVTVSALLGLWQEHGAARAVEHLLELVELRCTVLRTGRATTYGAITERLRLPPGETEFEKGVRRFGTLLLELTLVLVALLFAFNV
jgi:Mg2+-importing ATPase